MVTNKSNNNNNKIHRKPFGLSKHENERFKYTFVPFDEANEKQKIAHANVNEYKTQLDIINSFVDKLSL